MTKPTIIPVCTAYSFSKWHIPTIDDVKIHQETEGDLILSQHTLYAHEDKEEKKVTVRFLESGGDNPLRISTMLYDYFKYSMGYSRLGNFYYWTLGPSGDLSHFCNFETIWLKSITNVSGRYADTIELEVEFEYHKITETDAVRDVCVDQVTQYIEKDPNFSLCFELTNKELLEKLKKK